VEYINEIDVLRVRYDSIKSWYLQEKGKMEQLNTRRQELEKALQKSLDNIDMLEKIRILLQKVSEYAREQSRQQIESLVTNCLQYIFDTNIEFRIEISEVRGRPEAEFYVISNIEGNVIRTKPQEARGGGVVDVISLAIRVAMLQSGGIEADGPIILDEPAKHVSDEYIIQVAEFLKQVSRMFNRQVIMVTHNRHLSEIADKWHRVDMSNGVSRISNDS